MKSDKTKIKKLRDELKKSKYQLKQTRFGKSGTRNPNSPFYKAKLKKSFKAVS